MCFLFIGLFKIIWAWSVGNGFSPFWLPRSGFAKICRSTDPVIQGTKYQQKMLGNFFLSNPKSELLKKKYLRSSLFLNSSSSLVLKQEKKFKNSTFVKVNKYILKKNIHDLDPDPFFQRGFRIRIRFRMKCILSTVSVCLKKSDLNMFISRFQTVSSTLIWVRRNTRGIPSIEPWEDGVWQDLLRILLNLRRSVVKWVTELINIPFPLPISPYWKTVPPPR